ncbi:MULTISPECIES: type I polyketide synthase [Actinoalloteichus]|uniref:Polyketide synthase family protein n=1 Tax=Actinoalloteichus fjordicus TaxID=1612552 RepID=A0AAC9PQX1_9PSEU|nr:MULTISPECIES: type I polyketide synthase [Actinoalloteichus]APU13372.1 polyketide synthase family protein [Actinoalloteichus fjordicus]APU19322.1 polyketide synthase family protein [Actinoalloteichus sp. GBA129-24]
MADGFAGAREWDVAIIGMAGRFPGAQDLDEFWANLVAGREAVRPISDEEFLAAGGDPALLTDDTHVRVALSMPDADRFDAEFFGFLPTDAAMLDPQQRVFLETCQHALEDAGHDPDRPAGPIGVYAGSSQNEYYLSHVYPRYGGEFSMTSMVAKVANLPDTLANRVSYALNLTGPAFAVQTACSTSLVAVHLACQDLLNLQCDTALAGGVTVIPDKLGYRYVEQGAYSPDGRCRPFDRDAAGFIGGDGVGVVVLRRLTDALADGDHIRAVIKGTAINNDGSGKASFTAPSRAGQTAAILAAQANAEIDAADIGYVEAHGTGTFVGDPIEVAALSEAFRRGTDRRGFCALGSVKANVGHLDAAAGVTGLIKTVLTLEHGLIPPHPNFTQPNPTIDFESSPFHVNTEPIDWPGTGPRRAAVSSFGVGGTNAHVILEQAPPSSTGEAAPEWTVLPLSARTRGDLERMSADLADHLAARPGLDVHDVGHTLRVGRRALPYRRTVVCHDRDSAVHRLRLPLAPQLAPAGARPVVLLFGGGGAQYDGMGRELYETQPVFRAELDRCAEILRPVLDRDLRAVLHRGERGLVPGVLAGLLSTQYAVARLLMAAGITPTALLGHSLGEYTAACLSGVISLEDVLPLMVERERLIRRAGGATLSVFLGEAELTPYLTERLSLAAINAPQVCSVSGPAEDVADLRARLDLAGVGNRRLDVAGAAHSWLLDAILPDYEAALGRVTLGAPTVPYVSNVTGEWITEEQATDVGYWLGHLRGTVRFADGLATLAGQDDPILIEVGPGRGLGRLATECLGSETVVVQAAKSREEERPDSAVLLGALGRLWTEGVAVDWAGVLPPGRRVPLTRYPFARRRHWLDRVVRHATGEALTGDSVDAPLAAPDRRDGSNGTGASAAVDRAERRTTVNGSAKDGNGRDLGDLRPTSDPRDGGVAGNDSGMPCALGRSSLQPRPMLTTPFREPATELERAVAECWRTVLGIDQIGVDDGFFELGGDSLLVLRMASSVRDRLGVRLVVRMVFDLPTVAGVIAAIAAAEQPLPSRD